MKKIVSSSTLEITLLASDDLAATAGMGGAPSRPQDIVSDWNPNRGKSGQSYDPYKGESYQMSGHGPSYARSGEQFGYFSTRNDRTSDQNGGRDFYDKSTQTYPSGNRRHSA